MQGKYVPVLVITCHFLGEAVCVAAYRSTFAIDGIQHAVQPVLGELVAAERCLISGFPGHAADVTVVAGRAVAGVVIQVLRELVAADARQPAAEVVAVGQLGGGNAVGCPGLQAAQFIVGVFLHHELRIASLLVQHPGQSSVMVVGVGIEFGLLGRIVCGVRGLVLQDHATLGCRPGTPVDYPHAAFITMSFIGLSA